MKKPNLPMEINVETVREMRFMYGDIVADKMIKAHQNSLQKLKKDSNLLIMQQERKKLKHLGICTLCKSREAERGKTRCKTCHDNQRKHKMALYYRKKAKGLCVRCGQKKAIKGKTECPECRVRQIQTCRRYRMRHKKGEYKTSIRNNQLHWSLWRCAHSKKTWKKKYINV